MASTDPERWLVDVHLKGVNIDWEGFAEFGRDTLFPNYTGIGGVTIPGAQVSMHFVLPPDVADPGAAVLEAVRRAANAPRFARYVIEVVGEPEIVRASQALSTALPNHSTE